MSRQLDFEVGQPTFRMSPTKSANSIDKEAVVLDSSLESLFATPGHAARRTKHQWNGYVKDHIVLTSGLQFSS
jgi:hypothetical protein